MRAISRDTEGMVLLLLRLLSAPVLILGGSFAQRRFGQAVGGKLIGLPLTSLPLLALLTVSHGRVFAGTAASSILGAGIAQSAWCLAYVLAARRRGPAFALAVATATFAAVCILLYGAELPALVGGALAALSVLGVLVIWPSGPRQQASRSQSRSELVVRMAVAAAFTMTLTGASTWLGARSAGLIAAYPVLTVVLAVATHRRDGSDAAGTFLEGVMAGSLSVVGALAVVALMLPSFGPLVAFPAAVAISAAAQLVPVEWTRRLRSALA